MERHSIILSDIHMSEELPGDDAWMKFRHRRYSPDQDFVELFAFIEKEADPGSVELIFNGDLFDFDAPSFVDGKLFVSEDPRSDEDAIWTLRRILNHHESFVQSLGRLIDAGHRLVFISGNHDVQLTFPRVREYLQKRLLSASQKLHEAADQITFRSWFHRTQDDIHVEHGNQYDLYCSFRYPNAPFITDGASIQPTVGSLTFRHLAGKLGYFNPYDEKSFYLSFWRYILHWVKYYLFTARSLVITVMRGSLKTAATIWRHPSRKEQAREAAMIEEHTALANAAPEQIKQHAALFATPSDANIGIVLRELWIDRVLFIALGLIASVTLYLAFGWTGFIVALLATALAFSVYELITPKLHYPTIYSQIDALQPHVARIYGTRGVIFGHTHAPYATWDDGLFFGNTGTWSPPIETEFDKVSIPKNRFLIWLRSDEQGACTGGLYSWHDGRLITHPAS